MGRLGGKRFEKIYSPKPPFKNFHKAALTLAEQLLFCEKRVFLTFQEKSFLWSYIDIDIFVADLIGQALRA
ncbi:MAG: hypothetical protein HRT88_18945 [Lentisphaeraceae bacterium]|nr:hypothetical protein [Lentisphaeraceae bacterium]